MTRAIELSDTVYAALENAAAAAGLTPGEWIAAHLPQPASTAEHEHTLTHEYAGHVELRDSRQSYLIEHALPDSVLTALEKAAFASGTSPAEWITERLPRPEPEAMTPREGQPPRTLADRFEGLLGVVSLGRSDLSERAGELFADGMEEKYREGRL